jgi:hypothetical protein
MFQVVAVWGMRKTVTVVCRHEIFRHFLRREGVCFIALVSYYLVCPHIQQQF